MTFRRILFAALFTLAGGLLLPGTAGAQMQRADIVFINLDSVFTNYHKTRLAEAQLKEKAEAVKQDRKEKIDELKETGEKYKALQAQAKSSALTDEARDEKLAEAEELLLTIKRMEKDIAKLEDTARKQFEDQSRRARERLVDEINVILREYAKDKDLTAIIDMSGESLNGVPTVVYYRPELDITEEIIDLVNR